MANTCKSLLTIQPLHVSFRYLSIHAAIRIKSGSNENYIFAFLYSNIVNSHVLHYVFQACGVSIRLSSKRFSNLNITKESVKENTVLNLIAYLT